MNWNAVGGAVRYEVWRALEGALPEATAATTDQDLRALAAAHAESFELRSDQVFGLTYRDNLPGRAPVRALYRLRAINLAGVASPPSDLIGPVHVPDIRCPPAPNLLRAVATPPAEADRTIAVEWTMAGPTDRVRFDIQCRPADASPAAPYELAGSVPAGTLPGPGSRYRFLHREKPPGKPFSYQIVAVREALDPIDPTGTMTRDILSAPSSVQTGVAVSAVPLAAPVALAATVLSSSDEVSLTWSNRDFYETIQVRRKKADRFRYELVGTVQGTTETFTDTGVPSGTWRYQLWARGVRREARSAVEAEVVIP
jgi:hypothetical protein